MVELSDRLESMVEKMPAFPASVSTILEMTQDTNCAPKELVSVIEHDPVMTVKVLKLVNSAYFGLSREVASVKQSVVYIGINTIKNVVVSLAVIGVLPRTNTSGYSLDRFLDHSLTTAAIAKLLARQKGVVEKELGDYFVASLLHDIGQMVLAQFMPDEFQQALSYSAENQLPIHESEIHIIGVNHAEVGAILAEKWNLPKALIECIRNHHNLSEIANPSVLEKTVFVANQTSKLIGDDTSVNSGLTTIETIPPEVAQWLGMELSQVSASLDGLVDEIDKCKLFVNG